MPNAVSNVLSEHGISVFTDSYHSKPVLLFGEKPSSYSFDSLLSSLDSTTFDNPIVRNSLKKDLSLALFFQNYAAITNISNWKKAFGISDEDIPWSDKLLRAAGVYGIDHFDEPFTFSSPGFLLPDLETLHKEALPGFELIKAFDHDEARRAADEETHNKIELLNKLLNRDENDLFFEKLLDAALYDWRLFHQT